MDRKPFIPETSIYTPPEVSRYGKERIREIQDNQDKALKFFIPGIDSYFAPVQPGQVCGIIGQTSNYKSGFMDAWEYTEAQRLDQEGKLNKCIVHVSVEETVEEQAFRGFARESNIRVGDMARGNVQDWDQLERAAIRVGNIPIYRIGDSLTRAEDFPNLTLSNMGRAIKYLRDNLHENEMEISAIFLDYLQAFPIDDEVAQAELKNQRRLQVRSDVYRIMQMARYFGVPVVCGVQAKQIITANKKLYIPGKYDGEETSAIGQRWDRLIGLWMPKNDWMIGEEITLGDIKYTVEENLLFLRVTKQRGGLPSGKFWSCRIDYKNNRILVEPAPGIDPFDMPEFEPSFQVRS